MEQAEVVSATHEVPPGLLFRESFCKSRNDIFFWVFSNRLPSQLKKLPGLSSPKTSSKLTFFNPWALQYNSVPTLSPEGPVGVRPPLGAEQGVARRTVNIDDSWHKA